MKFNKFIFNNLKSKEYKKSNYDYNRRDIKLIN